MSGCTLHTETYSQVSCCSSASSYTFKKKETYSEVFWCIFASGYIVLTKRNQLLVSWDSSFQTMHAHRDLFLGILVHLYVILGMHTHAICAYPQEPNLGYPMQLCFRLHITHKDLLSGIRVQFFFFFFLMLYKHTKPTLRNPGAALFQTKQCIVYIQTRNYSWVSWYSSISSYKNTRHRDLL